MSLSTPFHKQTDPNKQAGQHRYSFDREPYLKHSNAAPDVTLSDYIKRKQEEPPRITFAQWLNNNPYILQEMPSSRQAFTLEDMEDCWNAALTKGKL